MKRKPTIYLDLDGTIADFNAGYSKAFGYRPDINAPRGSPLDVDWSKVKAHEGFYRDLPPMPDFEALWSFVKEFDPIVLSGVPVSVPEAAANKAEWVRKHMGDGVKVICCLSKEKYLHCEPGDILIDDWIKYRPLWRGAGGVFVKHTDAASTIAKLKEVLPS